DNDQKRDQHHGGADAIVNDKLVGRLFAIPEPPYGDEEIRRNERQLEEQEEQKQVFGEKDPEHAGLQQQEQNVIRFPALFDMNRSQRRHQKDQGGQKD